MGNMCALKAGAAESWSQIEMRSESGINSMPHLTTPKKISDEQLELYRSIVNQFKGRCALCIIKPLCQDTIPHHIVPRGVGGKDELDNLIPLCPECHGKIHREGTRKWRTRLQEIVSGRYKL